MRKIALCALVVVQIACSGENDPKGAAVGVGTGGASGAAGSSSLVVGGSSGRAAMGGGGQSGAAGRGDMAGAAGSAGQSGAAGGIKLQPSTAVCGNGKLEPGERCDGTEGTTTDISCAELLGDPEATGIPSCDRCFPSYLGCVSCLDGRTNGLETDIDCGGTSCAPCGVARACKVDADCAAPLGCYGGVCNEVRVTSFNEGPTEVPVGAGRAFVLRVQSTLPLPANASATLDGGPGVTLESTSPLDARRLIARVAPEASNSGTLTLDGHPFALTWIPPLGRTKSTLSVTGVSGKLGPCKGAGAPLVLEAEATGPTPAVELPVESTVCIHVDFSGTFPLHWNASLGTVISGDAPAPQSFLDLELPLSRPSAQLDAGNTTVDLAIGFGEGATTSLLVPQRLVFSPKTYRAGATGIGTTSSPVGVVLDTKALGGPYPERTVLQLAGPHKIGSAGLVVPDNLVIVGVGADASIGGPGGTTVVTLGSNSELRGLTVMGAASGGISSGDCVVVSGKAAVLRDVRIRGCKTGIQLKKDASLTMLGNGVDDLTQVTQAIIGESGASFTGVGLGLVGSGTTNAPAAIQGFAAGRLSLIRPRLSGFSRGLSLEKGALAEAHDLAIEAARGPIELRDDAALTIAGGTLAASDSLATGIFVRQGAKLVARGISITGAEGAGVGISGGAATLIASVFSACGGPNSAALYVDNGGSLRANGLRIEQPGQIGVLAGKDAQALSLTGAVVEATTFRSLWLYGGKATLRTVSLLDPGETGLAYGDPAQAVDIRDLDIVKHLPSPLGRQLVFADRQGPISGDVISFHALVAGAGKVVSSDPGAPVCATTLFDPNGGSYLSVNAYAAEVCF